MPAWDFDAARKERLRQRDPIRFTMGGQDFTCLPVVPFGVAWALADAPDEAELLRLPRPEIVRTLAGMVADMLVPDYVDRWWGLFQSKDEVIDDEAIYELVQRLTEEYTGRPTSPPTDSSDGRSTTGEPSSSPPSPKDSAFSPT